jgi:hypothetical protein
LEREESSRDRGSGRRSILVGSVGDVGEEFIREVRDEVALIESEERIRLGGFKRRWREDADIPWECQT